MDLAFATRGRSAVEAALSAVVDSLSSIFSLACLQVCCFDVWIQVRLGQRNLTLQA